MIHIWAVLLRLTIEQSTDIISSVYMEILNDNTQLGSANSAVYMGIINDTQQGSANKVDHRAKQIQYFFCFYGELNDTQPGSTNTVDNRARKTLFLVFI